MGIKNLFKIISDNAPDAITEKKLKHDIIPIFVFDGKPPELKSNILKERKQRKNKCIQNLKKDNYDNDSDRIKDFKKSFTLSKKHIDEVKHILNLFGIPTVESL